MRLEIRPRERLRLETMTAELNWFYGWAIEFGSYLLNRVVEQCEEKFFSWFCLLKGLILGCSIDLLWSVLEWNKSKQGALLLSLICTEAAWPQWEVVQESRYSLQLLRAKLRKCLDDFLQKIFLPNFFSQNITKHIHVFQWFFSFNRLHFSMYSFSIFSPKIFSKNT